MRASPLPRPSVFDRDEQRRLRVAEVLRVAASMFNTKGFGGTSLDDIAAELKISKPSLYHYFNNKQHLLFEVYLRAFEITNRAADEALRAEGSGLDRLIVFLTGQIEGMLDAEMGTVAILSETHSLTDHDRRTIKQMSREHDARIQAIIGDGMRDGSIRSEDANRIEFILMGMLNWIPKWFKVGGAWTAEDIRRTVIDLIVQGISTDRDRHRPTKLRAKRDV